MNGFVDSTVIIHLLRGNLQAQAWFERQDLLALTPIVWLEVMAGAQGKLGQANTLAILASFEIVFLIEEDQAWAMEKLLEKRLSHGVAINDCLIASVCQRLELPLYTHNVKHLARILDPALVIKPY